MRPLSTIYYYPEITHDQLLPTDCINEILAKSNVEGNMRNIAKANLLAKWFLCVLYHDDPTFITH